MWPDIIPSTWHGVVAVITAKRSGGCLKFDRGVNWRIRVVANGRGTVNIGAGVSLGYPLAPGFGGGRILLQARFPHSHISIGEGTELSNNISVVALDSVHIGKLCLIANNVTVFDSDFHDLSPALRRDADRRARSDGLCVPVRIGNNVWLGQGVTVLRGATIGSDSVVGAGSVVHGAIPDGVLAAGIPARVIRKLT